MDISEVPAKFAGDAVDVSFDNWGDDVFYCNNGQIVLLLNNGMISIMDGSLFTCDSATSQWLLDVANPDTRFPSDTKIKCVDVSIASIEKCAINRVSGYIHGLQLNIDVGGEFACSDGKGVKVQSGNELKEGYKLQCVSNEQFSLDGQFPVANGINVECVDMPSTSTSTTAEPTTTVTTTAATTTTAPSSTTTTDPTTTTTVSTTSPTTPIPKDQNLLSSYMLALTLYYNYGLGVHAFCATPYCYNSIQSNGIGYDPNNGKHVMGKVVSTDAGIVAAAKARCPIGWAKMRVLGFKKTGYAYEHNLNGEGLVAGYVSTYPGTCGATEPIKKWLSKVNTDIMYAVDLEWNAWYAGMAQNGGTPVFWIWPSTY